MRRIVPGLLASAMLACGRKPIADDEGGSGSSDEKQAPRTEQSTSPQPSFDPACRLPTSALINSDYVVKAGCHAEVERSYEVQNGATLTLEEGVRLSFQTGTHLWIEYGKLVAKGTADKPIVLTSINEKTPIPGEWEGIVFGERTREGTVLDHVTIEYAGRIGGHGYGAVTFYGAVRESSVSITHSIFRHDEQSAVHVPGEAATSGASPLVTFDGNVLEDHPGGSLHIPADVMRVVGENKLGDPIHLSGTITRAQTWPALDVPVIIDGQLTIAGKSQPAIVRLAEGTKLLFASKGGRIRIGEGLGGALVAKGATFDSAASTKAAGDWDGLVLSGGFGETSLEGCTFAHAAKAGGGVITIMGPIPKNGPKKGKKTLAVKGCAFENNGGPAFVTEHPCGELGSDKSGNTSTGQPLCALP